MTQKTSGEILQLLAKLGLTSRQARLYLTLLQTPNLTAKQLSQFHHLQPASVYRPLKKLEKLGLILSRLHPAPTRFQAVSMNVALELLEQHRTASFAKVKNEILDSLTSLQLASSPTEVGLFQGKQSLFSRFCQLVDQAQKEVLIISIGEPVPKELVLTSLQAIKRGVDFRIIVHRYNDDNTSLLQSWAKMGWHVRHLADQGYHLVVVDERVVLLAVNNPENTDNRVTIEFDSIYLAKAMRGYFFDSWSRAVEVG